MADELEDRLPALLEEMQAGPGGDTIVRIAATDWNSTLHVYLRAPIDMGHQAHQALVAMGAGYNVTRFRPV